MGSGEGRMGESRGIRGQEERGAGETRPRTVRVESPGAGAEKAAAGRSRTRRLTFAVEAGRVVIVKGRQLASEHGPRCSLRSPGMRPGEARRGKARRSRRRRQG